MITQEFRDYAFNIWAMIRLYDNMGVSRTHENHGANLLYALERHLTRLWALMLSLQETQHFGRCRECYLQHLFNISQTEGWADDRLGQDYTLEVAATAWYGDNLTHIGNPQLFIGSGPNSHTNAWQVMGWLQRQLPLLILSRLWFIGFIMNTDSSSSACLLFFLLI